ncbi:MAG TPA: hypothetical protein VJ672_11715 [Gemmatimonadaceae bacterium]|nr:hypothetical protein [Gemmatimonadaceae bacterium]
MKLIAFVGAVLLVTACVRGRGVNQAASIDVWATRDWPAALASAQQAAAEGRYDAADRELSFFAERNPGTLQAREASYWRAMFLLDPANDGGDPTAALAQLQRYLTDSLAFTPHRGEAMMLRRLATELDSLRRSTVSVATATARTTADSAATAKEREIELEKQNQALKEQLEKTTAELERIKKRLAERP